MARGAVPPAHYDGEIVDTHLHLWDLKVLLAPPWVAASTGRAREVLAHDHLLADYARGLRGASRSPGRSTWRSTSPKADQVKEAEAVTRLCAEGPVADASRRWSRAGRRRTGSAAYLDRFRIHQASSRGSGRSSTRRPRPPAYCLDPAFVRGVRLLGDRGLSFDLCLRNDQLDAGAELDRPLPRKPGSSSTTAGTPTPARTTSRAGVGGCRRSRPSRTGRSSARSRASTGT